ncbi:Protein os-9 [Globisporangium polare]
MKLCALALAAAASATLSTVTHALQLQSGDASYVVQIHASHDLAALGFVPDPATTRSQVMALESGQRFECFVPLTPDKLANQQQHEAAERDQQEETEEQREAAFVAFGRAAAKKIRPKCVQYVDMAENWVYEVCPGVLVRKVSLRAGPTDDSGAADDEIPDPEETMDEAGSAVDGIKKTRNTKKEGVFAAKKKMAYSHQVVELGTFVSDTQEETLAYSDFVGADTQERVSKSKKPLFTQVYWSGASADKEDLKVQFICSATAVDDTVAGVQWRKPPSSQDGKDTRSVAAFLVVSRVFCDPKHADEDEYKRFTVPSLLRPMVASNTCVKRNEGWWTYEFCFGKGIRQYHRDGEGRITAEFSLGLYEVEKNQELEASGGVLVHEHIDATHDVPRPAYLELYGQGTHCKEYDHWTPRRAKVYYYCSQGGSSHHILGVKETQTCVYAIKISSPALCDHPHFITEEQKSEAKAEIVHCVPMSEGPVDTEVQPQQQSTTTTTTTASGAAGASISG